MTQFKRLPLGKCGMALCRREQWLLLPVQELCRSWTLSLCSQTAAFISRARNAIYRTPPSASHVITPGYLLEGVTEVLWESFSWLWRELRWFRDLFLSSCFSWASNEQPVMHWCQCVSALCSWPMYWSVSLTTRVAESFSDEVEF